MTRLKRFYGVVILFLFVTGSFLTTSSTSYALTSSQSPRYVIITTRAIADASSEISNFITEKRRLGYNPEIITEATWGGGVGSTAAENIRNWLMANYIKRNIMYVLLIGNPDPSTGNVPMKMTYPLRNLDSNGNITDYRDVPTDFYYASLNGKWDLNGDGIYGQYDKDCGAGGATKSPSVIVGRIPYYGIISDLDKILRKTINYTTTSDYAWRKKVMIAMNPWSQAVQNYEIGQAVVNRILAPMEYKSGEYFRISDVTNPKPELNPCNTENVKNTWNYRKPGFVIISAHGSADANTEIYNYADDILNTSETRNLNDSYPSIVFGTSCHIARPETSYNLAYNLLKNGAISTVCSTRMTNFRSASEEEIATGGLDQNASIAYRFTNNALHIGKSVGASYYDFVKSASITEWWHWRNILEFNIYGDPSINLYPQFITTSGGYMHTLALTSNGTVYSWGNNVYGQLGDGNMVNNAIKPHRIPTLNNIAEVSCGLNHSMALDKNHNVWTWGYNVRYSLGNGYNTNSAVPK